MVKRNKFDEIDFVVLEDIKNNKKTSVFEEEFDIKNYLRYDKFRQNTMAFLKFFRDFPEVLCSSAVPPAVRMYPHPRSRREADSRKPEDPSDG